MTEHCTLDCVRIGTYTPNIKVYMESCATSSNECATPYICNTLLSTPLCDVVESSTVGTDESSSSLCEDDTHCPTGAHCDYIHSNDGSLVGVCAKSKMDLFYQPITVHTVSDGTGWLYANQGGSAVDNKVRFTKYITVNDDAKWKKVDVEGEFFLLQNKQ